MAEVTLKGEPARTNGELPTVGVPAPDFLLTDTGLSDLQLSDFAGKKIILNIFPSLDTRVCAESVRRFNAAADELDNTEVLCISRDTPFAHTRFNKEQGIDGIISLSELRNLDFGANYGIRITEGPFEGLLARSVVVIDEGGRVIYTQLVPDISHEPDYETALAVARTMGKDTPMEKLCAEPLVQGEARLENRNTNCRDAGAGF